MHRDETVREWLKMRCRRNFEQHRAGSEGDNLPLAAEEAARSNRAGRMGQPCGFWRPGIAKNGRISASYSPSAGESPQGEPGSAGT